MEDNMKFNKVKGMEDFFPKEMAVRNAVFNKLRTAANNFGFKEVEAPALETTGLLTAKSGEEIKSQLFVMEKKGKEDLALRFDLTVPITRMFVSKQRELPKPTKWYALSRMWRYERPQKGRLREFYQLSAELFGTDTPESVAECINLMISCLKSFGLTKKDFYIKINNRKLLEGLVTPFIKEGQFEAVTRMIDKKAKISEEAFIEELTNIGVSVANAKKVSQLVSMKGSAASILKKLGAMKLTSTGQEGFEQVKVLLGLLPLEFIVLDLSIARGLAYYTGTVFEVYDRDGKFRAIAGGGQYDELTTLLGGQNCPAVGFGMGYSTLKLLLEDKKCLPREDITPDYVIVIVSADVKREAFELANKMRVKYKVEIDLMNRKLKKQLDYANSLGAENIIFFGPDEVKSGQLKVKNLKTGEESVIPAIHLELKY